MKTKCRLMTHYNIIAKVGGKYYMKEWICSYIPPHHTYIEVFGGAAHVLLHKKKSPVEVYNDIDSDLVNLFKVARDQPDLLIERLEELPFSIEEFNKQKTKLKSSDCIDRAIAYFYLANTTINSRMSCFVASRDQKRLFTIRIKRIRGFAKRMKNVIIENADFYDVIKKYDSENTFMYLDPPYHGLNYYNHKFSYTDHVRLANALKKIKGSFLLSYYTHKTICKLYKNFKIYTKKFIKHSIVRSKKTYGSELLITNIFNVD